MKKQNKSFFFIIYLITIVIFSGCFSVQKEDTANHQPVTQQISFVDSPQTTITQYWIRIDPIKDYKTDSTFNITGSTKLIVKGTTNLPTGTMLQFDIIEENRTRYLLKTEIEIKSNNSGQNLFSFIYDMKGNPPGQYRVIASDNINLNNAISRFNITSDVPYYKWIRINPQDTVRIGENISVSGTTDLPAGSQILIRSGIFYHSCTMPTPDREGQRSLCGGSCRGTGSENRIVVVEGIGRENIWNSSINTTDWCENEGYFITVEAINWTNVTKASQLIRF